MIISVSRRTDVPAFYSEWFMNRVRAGYCLVANPFNPHQVRRVSLMPDDVTAFVFWTRNSAPMKKALDDLDAAGFPYSFLFTLTGLPRELERNTPKRDTACAAFRRLSERIGPDRVIWRYDPILISDISDEAWHAENFGKIAGLLESSTNRVIFSFADFYKKTTRRLHHLERDTGIRCTDISEYPDRARALMEKIADEAERRSMEVQSCCEEMDFSEFGISQGKCIDDELLARVFDLPIHLPKDKTQRPNCRCAQSVDIGAYNTCLHDCLYCYATGNADSARKNRERHDPTSESLL